VRLRTVIGCILLAAGLGTASFGAAQQQAPSGTIVFSSDRAARLIRPAVYTIGSNRKHRRTVTARFLSVEQVRWSPNQKWIAFVADGKLRLGRSRGGRAIQVARRRYATHPAWSRDGSRLAFLSLQGEVDDLFVLRMGTQRVRRVARGVSSGPSWSPDGRSIVYTSSAEMWIVDWATGAKHRVLDRRWNAEDPDWSPDGSRIAFAYGDDPNDRHRVYSLDLRGGKPHLLASNLQRPVWSPDGTRIVASTETNVHVITADGRHRRRIFKGPRGPEKVLNPVWARDSRRVAVASDEVYVLDADGRRPRKQVTFETPRSVLADREVSWSPDSRQLAYVAQPYDPGDGDLYSVSSSGRRLRALTRNWVEERNPVSARDGAVAYTEYDGQRPVIAVLQRGDKPRRIADGLNPAWSPDGGAIAFERGRDLYVISRDGSGERPVLEGPSRDGNPDWSPDGHELVFERAPESGLYPVDLWAVQLDGSGVRRITDVRRGRDPCTVTSASDPAWSPDGADIAFALLEAGNLSCDQHGGWKSVYLVRADGSGTQRFVTNGGAYLFGDDGAYAPSWSPDGTYLAFVSDLEELFGRAAGRRIAVVPRDGGTLRFLTSPRYASADPSWRP
jgi:Tol biopolymer transport system component